MLVDGLFDLVLVNTPLPDEFGHDMAQQAANDTLSGVILLAKAEIADSVAEKVEDDGVFVVPKPLSRVLFMQALRMTRAARSRLTGLQRRKPPSAKARSRISVKWTAPSVCSSSAAACSSRRRIPTSSGRAEPASLKRDIAEDIIGGRKHRDLCDTA